MDNRKNWDWEVGKKDLADISKAKEEYRSVHEYVASPDGERVAVPVVLEDETFSACVNGQQWSDTFEKLWYIRFGQNNKMIALVRIDDEWTVAVEGEPWEERFEYAWDPKFSEDCETIGFLHKRDNKYGVTVNGKPWEDLFLGIRDFCLSPDGKHAAATVQVEKLKEADTFKFLEGVWSVALDGKAWEEKYINTWGSCFSPDGTMVAAEIRTDICEYSVAVNSRPWAEKFGCVWEPRFKPQGNGVIAPVLKEGRWTLVEDGNKHMILPATPDRLHCLMAIQHLIKTCIRTVGFIPGGILFYKHLVGLKEIMTWDITFPSRHYHRRLWRLVPVATVLI